MYGSRADPETFADKGTRYSMRAIAEKMRS